MSYHIKTGVYEGPFDLLVSLVNRRQVNVMELSLTDIINDFLAHLAQMREMDIEITSEFLLLAGTLIAIKARLLLPDELDDDLEDHFELIEERDRLLSRLLACLTFKDVAAVFNYRMEAAARKVGRSVGIDRTLPTAPAPLPSVTSEQLNGIASRVLARPIERLRVEHLDLDVPSLEAALTDVRQRMTQVVESTFERMVEDCTRRVEVVTYFLAMLELARMGLISVGQTDRFAEITLRQAQKEPAV